MGRKPDKFEVAKPIKFSEMDKQIYQSVGKLVLEGIDVKNLHIVCHTSKKKKLEKYKLPILADRDCEKDTVCIINLG